MKNIQKKKSQKKQKCSLWVEWASKTHISSFLCKYCQIWPIYQYILIGPDDLTLGPDGSWWPMEANLVVQFCAHRSKILVRSIFYPKYINLVTYKPDLTTQYSVLMAFSTKCTWKIFKKSFSSKYQKCTLWVEWASKTHISSFLAKFSENSAWYWKSGIWYLTNFGIGQIPDIRF